VLGLRDAQRGRAHPRRRERGAADRAPGGGSGREPLSCARGDPRRGARGDRAADGSARSDDRHQGRERGGHAADGLEARDRGLRSLRCDGADLRPRCCGRPTSA
jgi:hypothetical protein